MFCKICTSMPESIHLKWWPFMSSSVNLFNGNWSCVFSITQSLRSYLFHKFQCKAFKLCLRNYFSIILKCWIIRSIFRVLIFHPSFFKNSPDRRLNTVSVQLSASQLTSYAVSVLNSVNCTFTTGFVPLIVNKL